MKIFGPLYNRAIIWSRHRYAPVLLTGLSFFEGFIFPVPPEVMLAPMAVANRRQALWFATLSLLGSLTGAMVGYLLGHFAFAAMQPLIAWLGWTEKIDTQVHQLQHLVFESPWRAFWLLVLVGFTPIPLKVFTWASGIVGVPFLPFLSSMLIGRGKRVYLVAGAIKLGGKRAETLLHRWIEPFGWITSAILIGLVGWAVWKTKFG
ncbi:DedA family protein [Xylella taiwanensis]|uniref:DedA family protein n=1 Tax=Xylella taiwanensis TaxID=1444770 RepID=Z9JLV2_9GAMM|nr:YqaA family protein [Xylella taiwanensis]AXI84454.1 membrane protein [Xylella taiwanensis]EWS79390.1 membrane protein [Xylella taiwanensis]MCD8455350.1 DedA family protein [Xylella taiwanensis]MCD8457754.1 DedA family protein [Xylella taiwanensis]MCD8459889.1 DedA family protein [Xylella taiwanensis]